MVEMYCVKCRAKRQVKDYDEVTTKNGKHGIRAKCPVCDAKMFKFMKKDIKGKGIFDGLNPFNSSPNDNGLFYGNNNFSQMMEDKRLERQGINPRTDINLIWDNLRNKYYDRSTRKIID